MDKINTYKELKTTIADLENKHSQEVSRVKTDFSVKMESLRPTNLLKGMYDSLSQSSTLKDEISSTTIGLITGYVSKKIFMGTSHSPVRKLASNLVMIGVTYIVTKHPEEVKLAGRSVFKFFAKMIGAKPH